MADYLGESRCKVSEIVDNLLYLIDEDKNLLKRLICDAVHNGYAVEFCEINELLDDCYYHFGLCLEKVDSKSFTEGKVQDFRLSVIAVGDEHRENPVCLKGLNIVDFLELDSERYLLSYVFPHGCPYTKGMIKDRLEKYLQAE